jgi:hypothetical protein
LSTDNITRSHQTTRSADVFSVGEYLSQRSAADACLTGAARVYLYQSAPSIFSFVRNLGDKGSPRSIVNRLGKHAPRQAFDVQVFDNNRSEVLNQPERETMLKFVPLIPDSSVNLLEQGNSFAPTLRAFLASSNLPLCAAKTGFGLLIETRIPNCRAVGEGREVFESNVNTNRVIKRWQRLGFAFNRAAYIPLAACALHGDGLHLARNRAMQLDFDLADALNAKHVAVKTHTVAVAGERDAVEAAPRLESGVACFFVTLHTAKERLEGFIHAAKDVLAAAKIRQTQIITGADFLQLIGLRVVVDRDELLPRIAAFLQRSVVETAGFSQLSVECFRPEARCE